MRSWYVCGYSMAILLCVMGCSRKPGSNTHSMISIKAPEGKVGSLSTMPANRKACYGVSVTGPGIPSAPAVSCSPSLGMFAGFVAEGGLLQISEVPRGSARKIELYAFLQLPGQDNPCPVMGARFSATQLTQVYRIGVAENISLNSDVVEVTINVSYPGDTQYLAAQMSMPSSCTNISAAGNPPGFHFSAGMATATGSGAKVIGRIGASSGNSPSASGGSYRVIKN